MCQNIEVICQCSVASPIELLIVRWFHQHHWLTSYAIILRLSFKPNVTCRPTRNLWFVNVFSTFRCQNNVVKMAVGRGPLAAGGPPMVQPAQWLIGH